MANDMPQRPATISQADLNRVMNVAKKHKAAAIEVVFQSGDVVRVLLGESENSGDKVTVKVVKKAPIRLG